MFTSKFSTGTDSGHSQQTTDDTERKRDRNCPVRDGGGVM